MKCDTKSSQLLIHNNAPAGTFYMQQSCPAGTTLMDGGFAVSSWFGLDNIESHADVDGGQNKRWFAFYRGAGSGEMQANNFASCCRMVAPGTANLNLDAPAEAGAFFEPAEQRAAKLSVGGSLPSSDAHPVDPAFATLAFGPGVIPTPSSAAHTDSPPDSPERQ